MNKSYLRSLDKVDLSKILKLKENQLKNVVDDCTYWRYRFDKASNFIPFEQWKDETVKLNTESLNAEILFIRSIQWDGNNTLDSFNVPCYYDLRNKLRNLHVW